MEQETQTGQVSRGQLWAGGIVGGLPALFLIVDAGAKFFKPAPVVEETVRRDTQSP